MGELADYLESEEIQSLRYTDADKGLRFANYFVDQIGMGIFLFLFGGAGVAIMIALGMDYSFIDEIDENSITTRLVDHLIGMIFGVIYYTFFEYLSKGKSLGKLLTKTRAITEDNARMDLRTCFIRSLCRIVPFEAFSFLANDRGWHDSWSKTRVIKDEGWVDFSEQENQTDQPQNPEERDIFSVNNNS